MGPPSPEQDFDRIFGLNWNRLPLDYTQFSDGAASPPSFTPPRGLLPSQRLRLRRLATLGRVVGLTYLFLFGLFLAPLFPLGAYRLTPFERAHRLDSILAGESDPLELRRAHRRYLKHPPREWSRLAGLPPAARVVCPPASDGKRIGGVIAERFEFEEPDNMRQWRLYLFEAPHGAEPECLLVWPAKPGDWRSVKASAGRVHSRRPAAESPIGWPPASTLNILGAHGWPTDYRLVAASWPKPGVDPLPFELRGSLRRLGDPPGLSYEPRPGTFWSYIAAPRQQHPPRHRFLDIFLLGGEALILETNAVDPRRIELDPAILKGTLPLITPTRWWR
ncbi:MAG: hypothetical protein NTW86_01460 [Candidatus Sumerlaeota bacterium]|nr:hypothetical protein [Candidatus Sumerlaeota bacterium]